MISSPKKVPQRRRSPLGGLPNSVQRFLYGGTDFRRSVYGTAIGWSLGKRLAHRRALVRTCPVDAKSEIPRHLGLRSFAPREFPGGDGVVRYVEDWVEAGSMERMPSSGKRQLKGRNADPSKLTADSPLIRLAIDPRVLSIVCSYLQVVPVLGAVDIWCSVFADGEPENSQLYHCDWADRTQVKMFVSCTDIGEENGPLVVLDAATSKRVRKRCKYRYHSRLDDGVVYRLGGSDAAYTLTGPKGSVAFVDTSRCFHYGSRLNAGATHRVMAMFQYLTPTAFQYVRRQERTNVFGHLAREEHSDIQRLVLGVEPSEEAAAA